VSRTAHGIAQPRTASPNRTRHRQTGWIAPSGRIRQTNRHSRGRCPRLGLDTPFGRPDDPARSRAHHVTTRCLQPPMTYKSSGSPLPHPEANALTHPEPNRIAEPLPNSSPRPQGRSNWPGQRPAPKPSPGQRPGTTPWDNAIGPPHPIRPEWANPTYPRPSNAIGIPNRLDRPFRANASNETTFPGALLPPAGFGRRPAGV